MDDHALTETAELDGFKRFVYQSYEKGHKIFSDWRSRPASFTMTRSLSTYSSRLAKPKADAS